MQLLKLSSWVGYDGIPLGEEYALVGVKCQHLKSTGEATRTIHMDIYEWMDVVKPIATLEKDHEKVWAIEYQAGKPTNMPGS